MPSGNLRCDDCGRWISLASLTAGLTRHRLLTPDSHLTREEWETLCPPCLTKHRGAAGAHAAQSDQLLDDQESWEYEGYPPGPIPTVLPENLRPDTRPPSL